MARFDSDSVRKDNAEPNKLHCRTAHTRCSPSSALPSSSPPSSVIPSSYLSSLLTIMPFHQMPDIDAPAPPPSPFHPIHPNSLIFLHRGQTRLQIANALSTLLHKPTSNVARIWLFASELEVIITFVVCAVMLYKKRGLGEFWAFKKRESQTGTFWVANAVFTLVTTVAFYLSVWGITGVIIASYSFAHISFMEWWWVIPLPWLPLAVGAYISIHGFIVGCSPRSPLSAFKSHTGIAARHKWYSLPVFRSATLVNTILVLPCVLLLVSTVALVAMSGRAYYRAKTFAFDSLPHDLLLQMGHHARGRAASMADADSLATDELIWTARLVAAKYMTVHRYVSINLIVFAFAAIYIFVLCLVYGIPNAMNLVDHACSRYPRPLPASCTTYRRKLWFLVTKAKPTCDHSVTQLSIASWKMTILAVTYIYILTLCVPCYAVVPIFIVCGTWPHRVQQGDLAAIINGAELTISVITFLSCTFVAIFSCVSSLDPVFRAVLGLNVIRTTIPVDVDIRFEFQQHCSEDNEFDTSQNYTNTDRGSHNKLTPDSDTKETKLKLSVRQSSSSIGSTAKSPVNTDFPEYPLGLMTTNTSDGVEAHTQRGEDKGNNHVTQHEA
ncbi:protein phosphatase 2c [Pseudozyma hubeiensis SY62]|uniref:Protein phosphatase 2c n=1 Tax=Pseudozyma hubeiensis (strain SY62) TaxID=1305764 RepID=R9PJD6_PSEHS|nr:protein phosphatase 2c [Pseudozyma hubeiensis SY62]GAC98230.1 protein phosphatase 2c [Pseudozyma hubeiensis SY62]